MQKIYVGGIVENDGLIHLREWGRMIGLLLRKKASSG
jgi:hypothetical protein